MKIDMHVHVTPSDISADYKKYEKSEPYFYLLSSTPHNKFATAEEIVAEMDKVGFDKAVIFGFGFTDMGLCRYVNDYVIEKVRQYPDKLIGYISVVPQHKDAAKEIERCYGAGLRGIGELFPKGQHIDLRDGNSTRAFADVCERLNIPVSVHTNEPVGHYYAGKTDTTLPELESFIENNPNLKVILAHWGGGILFFELMKEIRAKCANVYYDNAASIFLYDSKIYYIAKQLGLLEKVLFGSDFPLLSPSRYFKGIDASGLSEEDKALIYGGNAVKLLKETGGL